MQKKPTAHQRYRKIGGLLCLVFLLFGGCLPSWKLRRTAPEGTFSPKSRFALDAFRYSSKLLIDDLSAKDFFQKQRRFLRGRWKVLVRWLNYDFQRSVLQHSQTPIRLLKPKQAHPSDVFVLRPMVVALRTGSVHIRLSLPSQIKIYLQVYQGGKLIEEAELKHQTSAEIVSNLEIRLRKDAFGLGKIVASYLERRMRGLGPPDDEN